MGLIDTLTAGFRLAGRRAWLMLLPVLVDLWLLFGQRLSIQPVVDGMLQFWATDSLPAEFIQSVEPYRQMLEQTGASFNLWWLLDNGLTWLQTVAPRVAPLLDGGTQAARDVSLLGLLLLAPLILALGLGLGSAFLTAVASQMPASAENQPAERRSFSFWLRRGLRTWGIVLVYALIVAVVFVTVLLVTSFTLTPFMLVSPQVASALAALLGLALVWAGLWVYLIFYFIVAALVLDGAGLLDAARRSYAVVMRNFWASLGLVILTAVILTGFGVIWQRLALASPVGIAVAIGGNALLLTGLTAARLVFYRERFAALAVPAAAQVQ